MRQLAGQAAPQLDGAATRLAEDEPQAVRLEVGADRPNSRPEEDDPLCHPALLSSVRPGCGGRADAAAHHRQPDEPDARQRPRPMRRIYAVPKQTFTIGEAARALGVSIDTIRRWDREGRIETQRDAANHRIVDASEIERLRGADADAQLSARNRFRGVVREVKVDGLLAQVEIDVTEPSRVVAVITRESLEELGLKAGMSATGVVKATSVMVQR